MNILAKYTIYDTNPNLYFTTPKEVETIEFERHLTYGELNALFWRIDRKYNRVDFNGYYDSADWAKFLNTMLFAKISCPKVNDPIWDKVPDWVKPQNRPDMYDIGLDNTCRLSDTWQLFIGNLIRRKSG